MKHFLWSKSLLLLLSDLFSKSLFFCCMPGLNNEEYQVVIGNDTTSYIIDDLEPARNYSFYIVAYMPMGASRMSDQVSQHTLEDGKNDEDAETPSIPCNKSFGVVKLECRQVVRAGQMSGGNLSLLLVCCARARLILVVRYIWNLGASMFLNGIRHLGIRFICYFSVFLQCLCVLRS